MPPERVLKEKKFRRENNSLTYFAPIFAPRKQRRYTVCGVVSHTGTLIPPAEWNIEYKHKDIRHEKNF